MAEPAAVFAVTLVALLLTVAVPGAGVLAAALTVPAAAVGTALGLRVGGAPDRLERVLRRAAVASVAGGVVLLAAVAATRGH